jgi:hypothetical protein
MHRATLVLLVTVGCSGTKPGTTDVVGSTGETGTGPPVGLAGDCEVDPGTADVLAGAQQVLLASPYSQAGDGAGRPDGLAVPQFTDETAYGAFLLGAGIDGDPEDIDFATEIAVVATYSASSTCGVGLDGWSAWEAPGGGSPHVQIRIADASWGCDTVCDMTGAIALVLAVPKGNATSVTACAMVGEGCDGGFP